MTPRAICRGDYGCYRVELQLENGAAVTIGKVMKFGREWKVLSIDKGKVLKGGFRTRWQAVEWLKDRKNGRAHNQG